MKKKKSAKSKVSIYFAASVIIMTVILSFVLFLFVLGDPSNFQEGDPNNHPVPGNYMGIVYKGGIIVPFLMAFFLMVLTFSIERYLTIKKAYGRGSIDDFIINIQELMAANKFQEAIQECERQKGSIGNVVYACLVKYSNLSYDQNMNKEQKVIALQKEIEEAVSLELPMMEKNLTIIATLASIATLVGLLGTVIGMIKAFAALATAGAPDAVALANGISEALINTALGIATSAFAIVSYNYFTSQIDTLTYNIDEAGLSITQNFSTSQS
jgi:biopolymer transport protein ExbB